MNDIQIRHSFHAKVLRAHHVKRNTLVVDELGLNHGRRRADIAVINGEMIGYEIKSDRDSLCRLREQIGAYSSVFDRANIIVGQRHADRVQKMLPHWWGLIICNQGTRGGIAFKVLRKSQFNNDVDPISIAELLWRDEVREILADNGAPLKLLRKRRSLLYECLLNMLSLNELRNVVRNRLKMRNNWRCPSSLFPSGGLCRPIAKS